MMGFLRRQYMLTWFFVALMTWSAMGLPSTRPHDGKAFAIASSQPLAFTDVGTFSTVSAGTESTDTALTPSADTTPQTPNTDPPSTTESRTPTSTTPTTTTTTTSTTTSTTASTTDAADNTDEPNLVAILLGVLVPVAVIAVAAVLYVCFLKRRPK